MILLALIAITYGCYLIHPAFGWIVVGLVLGGCTGIATRRRQRNEMIRRVLQRSVARAAGEILKPMDIRVQ